MKLTPGDRNSKLAGHLKDQRGYTQEDKEWFIKEFKPYVNWYIDGQQTYNEEKHSKSFTLVDL